MHLARGQQCHAAMDSDPEHTFVRVALQNEHEQASVVLGALERLNINAAVINFAIVNGHAAAVVLRIPTEQLVEAICSLQYFGFGGVETQASASQEPKNGHDTLGGAADMRDEVPASSWHRFL
jgi:hypothetical protein